MILEKGRKAEFRLKYKWQSECGISAAFLHAAKMLDAEFVIIGRAHIMSGGLSNFGKQESQWKSFSC